MKLIALSGVRTEMIMSIMQTPRNAETMATPKVNQQTRRLLRTMPVLARRAAMSEVVRLGGSESVVVLAGFLAGEARRCFD